MSWSRSLTRWSLLKLVSLDMADDLNRFFGEDSFADTTLGVFGTISNTKR